MKIIKSKKMFSPDMLCPYCGEPQLYKAGEGKIKCRNCRKSIDEEDVDKLEVYKVKSSRQIKSSKEVDDYLRDVAEYDARRTVAVDNFFDFKRLAEDDGYYVGPEDYRKYLEYYDSEVRIASSKQIDSGLDSVKVTFDNGDTMVSDYNADVSREDIAKYYMNHWFNLGSTKDDMHKVVNVEFPNKDGVFQSRFLAEDENGQIIGEADTYEEAQMLGGDSIVDTEQQSDEEQGLFSSAGFNAPDEAKGYDFEVSELDGHAEYPMFMSDAWGHEFDLSGLDVPYSSYEEWEEDVRSVVDDDEWLENNSDYLDQLYDFQQDLCLKYYGRDLIGDADYVASGKRRSLSSAANLKRDLSGLSTEDSISRFALKNGWNKEYAKRILIKSGTMDIAGEVGNNFDLDGNLNSWFRDYVPDAGKASTVGGELVRAANQIIRRWNEANERIGLGKGQENVNPAARLIVEVAGGYEDNDGLEKQLNGDDYPQDYNSWIEFFEESFSDYLRNNPDLFQEANSTDMWDFVDETDVDLPSEIHIVDGDGNKYYFVSRNGEWVCSRVEFVDLPEWQVGDIIDVNSERGKQIDPSDQYGDFEDDNFIYSYEATSPSDEDSYFEWRVTNVELPHGLAESGDVWDAQKFQGREIFDENDNSVDLF